MITYMLRVIAVAKHIMPHTLSGSHSVLHLLYHRMNTIAPIATAVRNIHMFTLSVIKSYSDGMRIAKGTIQMMHAFLLLL